MARPLFFIASAWRVSDAVRVRLELAAFVFVLGFASGASSQLEIPARNPSDPQRFTTRTTGGIASGGTSVAPPSPPKVRTTTHLVLTESRPWTNTEGKALVGRLIAFEDLVTEVEPGAAPAKPPIPPEHPTVVKGGRVRLLVGAKACEILLDRLSVDDRKVVDEVSRRYDASPAHR